jgi:diacylglycerol kinase family enzyme
MTHIFIVNPYAGKQNFAMELRGQLEKIEGLNYFIFNTRHAGYEQEIVHRVLDVFPGEKLRFYSCGGSGTLRNVLNGFSSFENVEIAMYPKGTTNDFIKMFPDDQERFLNIEELISGDVLQLDYISTNHGICLNNFSTGLDSHVLTQIMNFREMYLFGKKFPYLISVLDSMVVSNPRELVLIIDGNRIEDNYVELIFGNGSVMIGNLHFTESASAVDGVGSYFALSGNSSLGAMTVLPSMLRGDYEKIKDRAACGEWKRIRIMSKDGNPFTVNQDGVMIDDFALWEAEIVPKGLPFVVPKGVKL